MASPAIHRPGTLDLNLSAVARYIQLAMLFRRRIEDGQWPAGRRIPTIEDLGAELGVARATVRQAIGLLEEEGLVVRYRAKGAFVLDRPAQELWCRLESDWRGLLTGRPGAVIEVVADEVVDVLPPHLTQMGAPSDAYRRLRRRHRRDGRVYLLADVYIDAALSLGLPAEAVTTETAMRLAASLPGVEVSRARQTLTIGGAHPETAAAFGAPLNAPVAHVHRSVADQHGRLVLAALGIYRGDVVRVDVELK